VVISWNNKHCHSFLRSEKFRHTLRHSLCVSLAADHVGGDDHVELVLLSCLRRRKRVEGAPSTAKANQIDPKHTLVYKMCNICQKVRLSIDVVFFCQNVCVVVVVVVDDDDDLEGLPVRLLGVSSLPQSVPVQSTHLPQPQ
jgi:hypothetical protein